MNRRTFVRGAAWSVPVVAIAAQAPAFAASVFKVTAARWCKKERSNGRWDFYFYPVSWTNGEPATATINGKAAVREYDDAGRLRFVLRNQEHDWSWPVVVKGATGTVGYSAECDTRWSSCPV